MKIFNLAWFIQRILRKFLSVIFFSNRSVAIRELSGIEKFLNSQSKESVQVSFKSKVSGFRSIFKLAGVQVNPKTGIVWFENKIVEESSVWSVSDLFEWEPRPLLTRKINGKFINLPDNGFYHFVIEDLPRFLEVFYSVNNSNIIIGSKARYIIEALAILNVTDYRVYSHPINCSEYLFSEKIRGGFFSDSDKERLLSFSDLVPLNNRVEKIFISRKVSDMGSSSRGVQLKNEIENFFENMGFQIVYFEEFALSKQISLSKSVKVLAGFHGAGLANLVWSRNSIQVIEITETRMTNHFKYLTEIYKGKYYRYTASEILKSGNFEFD